MSRPRSALLQEQRRTPRRRRRRHLRLWPRPAPGPWRRLQAPGSSFPEASARLYRAGVARATSTSAFRPPQGEWCGAGGGLWAGGQSGGSGRPGPAAKPEWAADGGVRGRKLPRQLRKHKDGGVICSRGPGPGCLCPWRARSRTVGNNARRAASAGPGPGLACRSRPPAAAAPGVGSRTAKTKTEAAAAPRPPARRSARLFLSNEPFGVAAARARRGEGPAGPAELPFCMTQWFWEKALLGFPE